MHSDGWVVGPGAAACVGAGWRWLIAKAAKAVAVAMAVAGTLQDDERLKTIKQEQNEDRNRLSDETPPHLRSAARNTRLLDPEA